MSTNMDGAPLLEAIGLTKHYPVRRGLVFAKTVGVVRAVDGIDLQARAAARRWRSWARAGAANRRRRASCSA